MNERKKCFYINPGTTYVVLFLFDAGKVIYMNGNKKKSNDLMRANSSEKP